MVWTEAPARAKVAGHPLLPIPTATASLPDSTRDLKPANVKVKADGTVKVLDFGLAKAFQPEASGASASESPTISLTAAATQMGMVIGTAAYMAPEQAKGKVVDKRADVWAFGVVLFEMLAGVRPFSGDDVSDTMAAVLRAEVDWSALLAATPTSIQRLLRRCLERDPKQRLRDIGDARFELDEFSTAPTAAPQDADSAVLASHRTRDLAIGALVSGGVVAAALSFLPSSTPESGSSGARITRRFVMPVPPRTLLEAGLAISPDGRRVVVAGGQPDGSIALFERRIDALELEPIRGTEGGTRPFFSPDGQWVGFRTDAELKRLSLDGGIPVTVAEMPAVAGVAWTSEGTWIIGQTAGPLLTMPDSGGTPQPLTTLNDGERGHQTPRLVPGGAAVVFTVTSTGDDAFHIAVQSLDGSEHRTLMPGSAPSFAGSGHLVFARVSTLWAVPFDVDQLTVRSEPVPVLEGVNGTIDGTSLYAIATEGTLIYEPRGNLLSRVVWLERDGTTTSIGNDEPVIHHAPIELSPDDRYLAVTRHRDTGDDEVMLYDLERGTSRVLVTDMDSRWPVWAPDGSRLTFASTAAGSWDIYDLALDGSAEPSPLLVRDGHQFPLTWSPDRRTLLFLDNPAGDRRLWLLPDEGEPVSVGEQLNGARIAPTGDWLAYMSTETGQPEVYVRSWPALGRPERVSTAGAANPRWSQDGRTLFFHGEDGVYSVSFQPGTETGIGLPQRLVPVRLERDAAGAGYDVTADGSRVVAIQPEQPDARRSVRVVLNWFEELKERVPVP